MKRLNISGEEEMTTEDQRKTALDALSRIYEYGSEADSYIQISIHDDVETIRAALTASQPDWKQSAYAKLGVVMNSMPSDHVNIIQEFIKGDE